MQRHAFKMKLKPGVAAEYKKRHDTIWPDSPIVRKWWNYMAPLMEVQPDHAPVASQLKEVFHLD